MTETSDPELATHYLEKHNWDVSVSQFYPESSNSIF